MNGSFAATAARNSGALWRDQYARQLRVIYHGVIMRTRCVNETYRVSGTIRGLDRTSERTADHKLRRESNCTIIVSRNCRRRAIVYYLNATYVIERRDKTPKTDIAAERIAAKVIRGSRSRHDLRTNRWCSQRGSRMERVSFTGLISSESKRQCSPT